MTDTTDGQSPADYMLGELEHLLSLVDGIKQESTHVTKYNELVEAARKLYAALGLIDGPFVVLTADDLLYPRYHHPTMHDKWRRPPEVVRWLADQARANLATDQGVPAVREHWRWLATCDPGD